MSETMESVKRQSMLLTKLVEPEVRSVVIHRLAVPLNEQAVGIYPLVADLLCKFVLLSFEFFRSSITEAGNFIVLCERLVFVVSV